MNLSTLRERIKGFIADSSYTDDAINSYINEVLYYVAGLVNLPTLKSYDVVNTVEGQAYTTLTGLSGGFSGVLKRVFTSNAEAVTIYSSLDTLMTAYPDFDSSGSVEAVALEGYILWYQKVPATATSLTVIYYKNPSELSSDSNEPSDFPPHLHERLFAHGVAGRIFTEIEDGIEGEKINTHYHKGQFFSAIADLRAWVAKNRQHYISSVWNV